MFSHFRKQIILLVVLLTAQYIIQAQGPVAIGQKAPGFSIDLLYEKKLLNLDSISKNKIVVIEFWATWCVPCIKAFPHLNELQKKFKTENVIFLSVTYESNKNKIDSFLKKHLLTTTIGLDMDLKMFKDYAAWAIPQTIIIDKQRNVVVSIHPEQLNENIIKDVLDGKPLNIPNYGKQTYFDPKGAEEYFRKLEKEGKN